LKIKYESEKKLIEHYDKNINYSSPINGALGSIFRYFDIDLTPFLTVLDVGCGTGYASEYVLNRGCDVVGIDYSRQRILQANMLDGLFISADINIILPYFGENLFDFIMLFEVLEHLENPNEVLKQCRRILKPDGLIFGSLPINSHYEAHLQVYSGIEDIKRRLVGLVDVSHFMDNRNFAFFKSNKNGGIES